MGSAQHGVSPAGSAGGVDPAVTRAFRRTAGSFATGVTIATSNLDDIPVAMTINSFSTASLDPMLLLICLGHRSRLLSWVRQSGVFAVTVLAAHQSTQAKWFANSARPTGAAAFAGFRTHQAPSTGCLLFSDGLAYFDCRVRDIHDAGDHAIVVGEAMSFGPLEPAKAPLLFVGGAFASGPVPEPAERNRQLVVR